MEIYILKEAVESHNILWPEMICHLKTSNNTLTVEQYWYLINFRLVCKRVKFLGKQDERSYCVSIYEYEKSWLKDNKITGIIILY